jgi:hypothetical protein
MAKRKNDKSKRFKDWTEEEKKALYAEMRAKFSAADLQKYTEIEEGIPARQVLAEMEKYQQKHSRERG